MRVRPGWPVLMALIVLPGAGLLAGRTAHAATRFAGDFLAVGIGPRAMGMGGAVTATATGTDAAYWNPAGLASLAAGAAAFEHAERFGGIVTHDALGAALPLRHGGLGFLLFRGAVDGIPYADSTILPDPTAPIGPDNMPDPSKVHTFSNADYVMYLAYGRPILGGVEVGASAKLIRRTIDRADAFGYGLDLGARWAPTPDLALGLMLRDISTTRVSWDAGQTDVVYPSVRLGAAYTWRMPAHGRLTVAAGSTLAPQKAGYGGLAPWKIGAAGNPGEIGAEYGWRETVFLRLGAGDVRGLMGPGSGQIAAGVGLRTRLPWTPSLSRVGLDVAWMRHDLRDSFRVGAMMEL